MTTVRTDPPVPWFRVPLVWLIIGIPLSSVIMGGVLLTLAISSYDGLVVDDYYKRGLEINRVLDRDRAAALAALEGELRIHRASTEFDLNSAREGTRFPDELVVKLSYATRSGIDRELLLRRGASGSYHGQGVDLASGRWYVEVGTAHWRLTGHLDAPGNGSVGLRAGE